MGKGGLLPCPCTVIPAVMAWGMGKKEFHGGKVSSLLSRTSLLLGWDDGSQLGSLYFFFPPLWEHSELNSGVSDLGDRQLPHPPAPTTSAWPCLYLLAPAALAREGTDHFPATQPAQKTPVLVSN